MEWSRAGLLLLGLAVEFVSAATSRVVTCSTREMKQHEATNETELSYEAERLLTACSPSSVYSPRSNWCTVLALISLYTPQISLHNNQIERE